MAGIQPAHLTNFLIISQLKTCNKCSSDSEFKCMNTVKSKL